MFSHNRFTWRTRDVKAARRYRVTRYPGLNESSPAIDRRFSRGPDHTSSATARTCNTALRGSPSGSSSLEAHDGPHPRIRTRVARDRDGRRGDPAATPRRGRGSALAAAGGWTGVHDDRALRATPRASARLDGQIAPQPDVAHGIHDSVEVDPERDTEARRMKSMTVSRASIL
jgi:hypothetical protein